MMCPVCYSKIEKDKAVCDACGFNFNELKTASNSAVKLARKQGNYDAIISTTEFPSDLDYKKTFYLAVFGGWFGLHNFYVNKTFRAWFNILSLVLSLIGSMLVFTGVLPQEFMSAVLYTAILYAITLIMWVFDLIGLVFKSYKVPVVLKKNIKKGK